MRKLALVVCCLIYSMVAAQNLPNPLMYVGTLDKKLLGHKVIEKKDLEARPTSLRFAVICDGAKYLNKDTTTNLITLPQPPVKPRRNETAKLARHWRFYEEVNADSLLPCIQYGGSPNTVEPTDVCRDAR